MIGHLTVVGDRQHGKTELLLRYAFDDAAAGLFVVYQCEGREMAKNNFWRAELMADGLASVANATRVLRSALR